MNYKDGRTLKRHYCKCGKKISLDNALYGTGLCEHCGHLNRKFSQETKEKIRNSLRGRKRPEISRNMVGKGNHRFQNKTHYCKNCNKKLRSYTATYYWDCYIDLELNKGINAPNFIHGLNPQKYPKEFNQELKERIRKRDNYVCQNCSMTEEEHLIVCGFVLDIHHIDYNVQNCIKENLISLCKGCNIRANYNRNYWKEYFKLKILQEENHVR